ncbi:MAG: GTPase HflX [Armatimonadetes bacterium]|nr:GTPase HflX [Armatimonadota bacterium]
MILIEDVKLIQNFKEKTILAALILSGREKEAREALFELELLAYSAGAEVVDKVIQRKDNPEASFFIGKGKAQELRDLALLKKANLIVFLNDLRPIQERNLTELIGKKVIDRQALILDIFAQRAKTKEGKIQVELAQLNYLLPRLTGYGIILSRLGGGIGTRGPGETKLESDRRHISRRIATLNKELKKIRQHRNLLRESRHNKGYLIGALVGYTNSGKSTLLNALTGSNVLVEDKVFATLDPATKKLKFFGNKEILLEVKEADIILPVLDVSSSSWKEHYQVVNEVLEDLAVDDKPRINILNKIDLIKEKNILIEIKNHIPEGLFISALRKESLRELINKLRLISKGVG